MLASMLTVCVAMAAPPTLRVDLYHSGDVDEEHFAVDRVVVEPLPFPGNPDRAVDELNLGLYLFEVRDRGSNKLLYSRGYASIYGEWQTTADAQTSWGTFSESLRFPRPAGPVQLIVKKRDAKNAFRELWSAVIDPADRAVIPAVADAAFTPVALHKSGAPEHKLDLLLLGDGYTAAECPQFEAQARALLAALFAVEPFASRRSDLNVWALCPPAAHSGVSRPSTGVHRKSPLGASYDAFGSERYLLTMENRALRDVAAHAPYDVMVILANSETYGGGGIHGLYSTVAAKNRFAPYLLVHELGHNLAGLADEYFTSEVAYLSGELVEPWEPNVTTIVDPARLKWKASKGAPLPTPWDKDGFVQRSQEYQTKRKALRARNAPERELDALFLAQKELETRTLGAEPHARAVGAFEGASYQAKGMYRAQADCVMFSRNDVPFCAACRAAIERVLDQYTKR